MSTAGAHIEATEWYFRPMREEDLGCVLAIERLAYDFPWTPVLFQDCLRAGYCCRLLEQDGAVAGYGIMSVAAGEAHILNLCVAPPRQGAGLGPGMLYFILDIARGRHAEIAFLEVRASNRKARLVYRHNGFVEVGARRDYYPAAIGREDAVIMARRLV